MAFALDAATSSMIVIPFALMRGGMSLPFNYGLFISIKTHYKYLETVQVKCIIEVAERLAKPTGESLSHFSEIDRIVKISHKNNMLAICRAIW